MDVVLDVKKEEDLESVNKIDSLIDVAYSLRKSGSKLMFGNLEAIKPFISCAVCLTIKGSSTVHHFRF